MPALGASDVGSAGPAVHAIPAEFMSYLARLVEDRVALGIAIALIIIQIAFGFGVARVTLLALRRQSRRLDEARGAVRRAAAPAEVTSPALEVGCALQAAYGAKPDEEVLEPEHAFSSDRLLPRAYNGRLDAAAPGLFTAMGIVGTFLGLVLAFTRVDFADPAMSIRPLIGGMLTSFLNSLAGVLFSIAWTVRSRVARHRFDVAAADLLSDVEAKFGRPSHGSQVLQSLRAVRGHLVSVRKGVATVHTSVGSLATAVEGLTHRQRAGTEELASVLGELKTATSKSSQDLLESLAPRLEQSFKSLVDMPFERLTTSVDAFRVTVDDISAAHTRTLVSLDAASTALTGAQDGLSNAINEAKSCVDAFDATVGTLKREVEATASIVESSRQAASSLQSTTAHLETVGLRHGQLASALGASVTELRATAGALDAVGTTFTGASERLEAAVARVQDLGTEAAESSVQALREELEGAVQRMTTALTRFGNETAAAYEASASRVVSAVDDRTSDLTDRLSAELATLAARLPESATEITRSAAVMRKQLADAVGRLEQAVRTLDATTTQTLVARLQEYDRLVAQAVDHFSGTLLTWDGKVGELGEATKEFRAALAADTLARESRRRTREDAGGDSVPAEVVVANALASANGSAQAGPA